MATKTFTAKITVRSTVNISEREMEVIIKDCLNFSPPAEARTYELKKVMVTGSEEDTI